MEKDAERFRNLSVAVYAAMLAVAALLWNFAVIFSLAFGGMVALLNLAYLWKLIGAALKGGGPADAARVKAVISFYLRFFALGGVILALNEIGWINFPALIAGLSSTVGGAMALALLNVMKALKGNYERAY
ncbi:MAG: ATP synthase subunit I [Nitrospinae bacterium]|nr:ATP synthase subunit I [Nitrospinota bacterium]